MSDRKFRYKKLTEIYTQLNWVFKKTKKKFLTKADVFKFFCRNSCDCHFMNYPVCCKMQNHINSINYSYLLVDRD